MTPGSKLYTVEMDKYSRSQRGDWGPHCSKDSLARLSHGQPGPRQMLLWARV